MAHASINRGISIIVLSSSCVFHVLMSILNHAFSGYILFWEFYLVIPPKNAVSKSQYDGKLYIRMI